VTKYLLFIDHTHRPMTREIHYALYVYHKWLKNCTDAQKYTASVRTAYFHFITSYIRITLFIFKITWNLTFRSTIRYAIDNKTIKTITKCEIKYELKHCRKKCNRNIQAYANEILRRGDDRVFFLLVSVVRLYTRI